MSKLKEFMDEWFPKTGWEHVKTFILESGVELELRDLYYGWWKEVKENEDFDASSDEAQEKLELLIRHRRYLWT